MILNGFEIDKLKLIEMEIWKDVKRYEGFYQVSNIGRIRSIDRVITTRDGRKRMFKGRHIKVVQDKKSGYSKVNLSGINRTKCVHRLVAQVFIPNVEDKPCIDHINGIRSDNRVENLRWCTSSENNNYPIAILTKSKAHKGKKFSEDTKAKMSVNSARLKKVDQINPLTNDVLMSWESIKKAAESLNIKYQGISRCCRGLRITYGNFRWKYTYD